MENSSKILVQCPKCNMSTDIEIPAYMLTKKVGSTKIKITKDICCAHEFIIFLDKHGKILGSEAADVFLEDLDFAKENPKIYLKDLVEIYGKKTVAHMLFAVLCDIPLVFLSRKDISINVSMLRDCFRKFIPQTYENEGLITTILDVEFRSANLTNMLVIEPVGKTIAKMDSKGPIKYFLPLIDRSLEILDLKSQCLIIQEHFRQLLERAELLNEKMTKWKTITNELCRVLLRKEMEYDLGKDELVLLKYILQFRFEQNMRKFQEMTPLGLNASIM